LPGQVRYPRSRGPRAWPLPDRPRPGAPSGRHRRRRALAGSAAVIAAVMAGRGV